jgi:broad specificity phosphatase PhoE
MQDKTTLLFAARHGETTANAQGLFRGNLNPPLNESGREDADSLANYFEPIKLSAIFYSDKRRSEETAHVIASRKPGIQCFGTSSLHPWNVGMFSGQPKSSENVQKLEYYIQNPDIPIPQGESLQEFKNRIRPCIMEGMELANNAGAPVLFVVHSSVVHEIGSMIRGDHSAVLVEPGGIAQITTDGHCLCAEPILKALKPSPRSADTIS